MAATLHHSSGHTLPEVTPEALGRMLPRARSLMTLETPAIRHSDRHPVNALAIYLRSLKPRVCARRTTPDDQRRVIDYAHGVIDSGYVLFARLMSDELWNPEERRMEVAGLLVVAAARPDADGVVRSST